MKNPYQSYPAIITKVFLDAPDTRAFTLRFQDKKLQDNFKFTPGQFIMAGLPGIGEIPVGISSSPLQKKYFQIVVRGVGRASKAVQERKEKETLFIRGPYGNGWPMEKLAKSDILIIAGGMGIVPLKPLIDEVCQKGWSKQRKVHVFYGSRSSENLLYETHYRQWRANIDMKIVLDAPEPKWKGEVGRITDILKKNDVSENTVAVSCGPPIMYKFLVPKLLQLGLKEENIYLSLERKMYCGIGVCEHCACGTQYVCKDGPVFNVTEINKMPKSL